MSAISTIVTGATRLPHVASSASIGMTASASLEAGGPAGALGAEDDVAGAGVATGADEAPHAVIAARRKSEGMRFMRPLQKGNAPPLRSTPPPAPPRMRGGEWGGVQVEGARASS